MSFDDYLNSMTSQRIKILELENSKLALENNQLAKVVEEMSHEISRLNDEIYSICQPGVIYMDSLEVVNYKDYLVKTSDGSHYVANRKFDVWYDSYSGDEISGVIRVANLQSDW